MLFLGGQRSASCRPCIYDHMASRASSARRRIKVASNSKRHPRWPHRGFISGRPPLSSDGMYCRAGSRHVVASFSSIIKEYVSAAYSCRRNRRRKEMHQFYCLPDQPAPEARLFVCCCRNNNLGTLSSSYFMWRMVATDRRQTKQHNRMWRENRSMRAC